MRKRIISLLFVGMLILGFAAEGRADTTATRSTASSAIRPQAGAAALGDYSVMPLSSTVSDMIVSPAQMEKYVKNLKAEIRKLASGNMQITITGRVKGPYRNNSTDYHYYWGPFLGFTFYGKRAVPACTPDVEDSQATRYYHLIPDSYDTISMATGRPIKRFLNQTGDILTACSNGSYLKNGVGNKYIYAYLSESHTETGDKCGYKQVPVAKIVSCSNNTPAESVDGSAEFDLVLRIELSEVNEALTGVYLGSFEYGRYSGSGTDASASHDVSSTVTDLSAAWQSAVKGKVSLSFRPGIGSGGPGTVELTPGSSYTAKAPAAPLGYRFLCWNGFNGTVPEQDTSYDAVYEQNRYHMRFDCAGGAAVPDRNDILYTVSGQFPDCTKKGYSLSGWKYTG